MREGLRVSARDARRRRSRCSCRRTTRCRSAASPPSAPPASTSSDRSCRSGRRCGRGTRRTPANWWRVRAYRARDRPVARPIGSSIRTCCATPITRSSAATASIPGTTVEELIAASRRRAAPAATSASRRTTGKSSDAMKDVLLRFLDHVARVPDVRFVAGRGAVRVTDAPTSALGRKAASLYDAAYARALPRARRRARRERGRTAMFVRLAARVSAIAFAPPIDALDLGCGTGRYFCALTGVAHAGRPRRVGGDARGSAASATRRSHHRRRTIDAGPGRPARRTTSAPVAFDLVYSIGVLAEHAPLDATLVARVRALAAGRAAASRSRPCIRTRRRCRGRSAAAVGALVAPLPAGAAAARGCAQRLLAGGLYADERASASCSPARSRSNRSSAFESEAHLHCLCVARKRAA